MNKTGYGAGVFTIHSFLTPHECQQYIQHSEHAGYEDAAIQTREGAKIIKTVRNNDRVIFDDVELAATLYQGAQPFLPKVVREEWQIVGLNERFRYYRYTPGQYFKWHRDGHYCRSEDEVSMLTFLIYLNDAFTGGWTELRWDAIKPEIGMVLVFPHNVLHQGAEIESGVKYVLRTDVMYCQI